MSFHYCMDKHSLVLLSNGMVICNKNPPRINDMHSNMMDLQGKEARLKGCVISLCGILGKATLQRQEIDLSLLEAGGAGEGSSTKTEGKFLGDGTVCSHGCGYAAVCIGLSAKRGEFSCM